MPKVEKSCEACGKSFSVWPNRADTAKTCSPACRGALTAARYKEKRTEKVCVVCGKSFECPPSHEKRRACCSIECAHELSRMRDVPTGDAHFNWRGGSTVSGDGYLYLFVEGHPFVYQGHYVLEHRLVVEQRMREEAPDHHFLVAVEGTLYLRPEIDVHHQDEDKRNNHPDNLLACTKAAHRAIHNGQPPMEGEAWPPMDSMVPFTPYRVTCTCENCGKKFPMKRSNVARGAGRFCSRDCYNSRRSSRAFRREPPR